MMFYKTTCIFLLAIVFCPVQARSQGLNSFEMLDRLQYQLMGKMGISKRILKTEACDFGKTTHKVSRWVPGVDSLGRITASYDLKADTMLCMTYCRTYTKTGKPAQTFNYRPDGTLEHTSRFFYDSNDSLILIESDRSRDCFIYETCGDTVVMKRITQLPNSEKLESITYITDNGKRQLTTHFDGGATETLTQFDDQHRIIYKQKGQRFRREGYRFTSSTQYTYDDRGRLISSQFREEGNNVSLHAQRFDYQYSGDHLVKITRTRETANIDSLVFQWNNAGQIACIILHDKYETYGGSIIHLFYHENGLLREYHFQGLNMHGDDYFAIIRYTYQ